MNLYQNKALTRNVSPLESTLTKNTGEGAAVAHALLFTLSFEGPLLQRPRLPVRRGHSRTTISDTLVLVWSPPQIPGHPAGSLQVGWSYSVRGTLRLRLWLRCHRSAMGHDPRP